MPLRPKSFNGAASVIEAEVCEAIVGPGKLYELQRGRLGDRGGGAASSTSSASIAPRFNGAASVIEAEAPLG